jgi:hypothetical protein
LAPGNIEQPEVKPAANLVDTRNSAAIPKDFAWLELLYRLNREPVILERDRIPNVQPACVRIVFPESERVADLRRQRSPRFPTLLAVRSVEHPVYDKPKPQRFPCFRAVRLIGINHDLDPSIHFTINHGTIRDAISSLPLKPVLAGKPRIRSRATTPLQL